VNRVKSIFSGGFNAVKSNVSSIFNGIKTSISTKLGEAKNIISGIIGKIKDMFPFKLGKIFSFSVPKITIGSIFKSVGGKSATAPSFDVSYKDYAKAMTQPYLFTEPTIFARAGEAGDEMLYGRSALMRDIREAANSGSGVINIYLNYDASNDANDMVRDIARGIGRYKMAGAF